MSAAAHLPHDEWSDIVRLVRAYARRKYGWTPSAITIHSPYPGVQHLEPFTAPEGGAQVEPVAARLPGRKPDWDSGPEPNHLSDFRAVYWPGLGTFTFSETQALVVEQLWDAMEEGTWEVGQETLLRRAGKDSTRLQDVFKGTKGARAYGTLIVAGKVPGNYRLVEPPDPDDLLP